MKILFIANGIVGAKPGVSGGETRFLEIAKVWQKKGHEIHLLAPAGAKTMVEDFGLKAILHPITRIKSTARWVFILLFSRHLFPLPQELKKIKFDIVYSTSEQIYDVLPAYKIKKNNPKTKWATVVHWLPPWPIWKRTGSRFWNSLLFFISERIGLSLALKKANILLPVSDATATQLREINVSPSSYETVLCGVNFSEIDNIAKKVKTKKYDAVFMKRIQLSKGIIDLIEAWKKVVSEKKDAKLLVIGAGIDGKLAKDKVKQLKLEKSITFTGALHDPIEKFSYLAESKTFVLPTHEENWAITIGEAMAAGLPVIATDLKELKAVWQDSFYPVPKKNVDKLAQAILYFLNHADKRNTLGKKGREFVKRYDWRKIALDELKYILKH